MIRGTLVNKFFLNITLFASLITSLTAGSLHGALFLSPKEQELENAIHQAKTREETAANPVLWQQIIDALSRNEEMSDLLLSTPKKNLHRELLSSVPNFNLNLANLIIGYVEPSLDAAPNNFPTSLVDLMMDYEEQRPDIAFLEIPHQNNTNAMHNSALEKLTNQQEAAQQDLRKAQQERDEFNARMAEHKRLFKAKYDQRKTQNDLLNQTNFRSGARFYGNIIAFSGSYSLGIKRFLLQKDLFAKSRFALRYPNAHKELNRAFFGALPTIFISIMHTMHHIINRAENPAAEYPYNPHCGPQIRTINAPYMFGSYMLLHLAQAYGLKLANKVIDVKKYDKKLRSYVTDPLIDIDYDALKNNTNWLAKTILAARMASTYA